MRLILATDIFGRTHGFDEMAGTLTPLAAETIIVDPYDGVPFGFKTEDQAYAHFQRHVGLDRYAGAVSEAIGSAAGPMLMAGFSAGASALWVAAAGMSTQPDVKALCFYGSQIRHRQELNPAIEIEMFFPRTEPHFDIATLCRTMAEKNLVTCHPTNYLHGFMNRQSKNFNSAGYNEYLNEIKKRIEDI